MAVAITDFLQASALLCQDALHIPNDHAASNIADELLLRITADFEALAARLVHRDTSGLLQNQVFATQQLARACRKVCLDITLRLKRTAANENDHTTVHRQVSFGVTWTRPDVDALITRILDLSSKWKDINAFDK